MMGRVAEAKEVGAGGLALLDSAGAASAPRDRAALYMALGHIARVEGDSEAQLSLVLEGGRIAEASGDAQYLARALNALGVTMSDRGMWEAQQVLMERSVEIGRRERLIGEVAMTLGNMCAVYPRDLPRGTTVAREAVDVARQSGDLLMVGSCLASASFAWYYGGDWDLLIDEYDEYLDGRGLPDMAHGAAPARVLLASVHKARGEPMREPEEFPASGPGDELLHGLVTAFSRAADGDAVGAAADVATLARALTWDAQTWEDFELWLAHVVELQLDAGDVDTAAEMLDTVTSMADGRLRPLSHGVLPWLRGRVTIARGGDPEADLREAERALDVYGAPYLLARARLDLGRWLQTEGRSSEAEVLLAQAREVFVALGARPWVAAVDAVTEPVEVPA